MDPERRAVQAFEDEHGVPPPLLVRAPGRVNLIGEHTDYNEGYVMPMAIDRAVWIALRPTHGGWVRVRSLDFDQVDVFHVEAITHRRGSWAEYVRGVAWSLQAHGYELKGWEGTLAGDVPIGAGLSSSAALEMAALRAFVALTDRPWEPARMARLGQQAENCWVGVNCGIMDQMISAGGVEGHALLIDCRSLDARPVPLPPSVVVVVLDTATRRGLVDSAYNERRAQCEMVAGFFGVASLRDVSLPRLEAARDQLGQPVYRRARHVVTENLRVLQACKVMSQGDAVALGGLLAESHASLREDFEVSSSELDTIVECAMAHPACYGARMTGAGFGGCAVALVRSEAVADFGQTVVAGYSRCTGLRPRLYVCQATRGAEVRAVRR